MLGRDSLSNKVYAGIGLSYLDSGVSYESLCALAVGVTGKTTFSDVVDLLWNNVVGGPAPAADKAYFVGLLQGGMSIGALTALAADTSLKAAHIDLVGLSQAGLAYQEYLA